MINWLVRFKNRNFWISFVPAALLLAQAGAALFGLELNLDGLSEKLLNLVNALFAVLALLGVVADHGGDWRQRQGHGLCRAGQGRRVSVGT